MLIGFAGGEEHQAERVLAGELAAGARALAGEVGQRDAGLVGFLAGAHREATGIIPALLLDDPFAELDRRRTGRILALLEEEGVGQCVLCVPREDEIPPQFTRLSRWSVRAGTFTP